MDTVVDGECQMRVVAAERTSMQGRGKTGGALRCRERDGLGRDDDERLAFMHTRRSLRLSIDKFSDLAEASCAV